MEISRNCESVVEFERSAVESSNEAGQDGDFYRCPYCFVQISNDPKTVEDHLVVEYSTRGIPPVLIQSVLKKAGQSGSQRSLNGDTNKLSSAKAHNETPVKASEELPSINNRGSRLQELNDENQLKWNMFASWAKSNSNYLPFHPSVGHDANGSLVRLQQQVDQQRLVSNPYSAKPVQRSECQMASQHYFVRPTNQIAASQKLCQSNLQRGSFTPELPVFTSNFGPGIEAVNWCAHCSMTFRLTSDLVQHMRNFHSTATSQQNSSESHLAANSTGTLTMNSQMGKQKLGKNFQCSSCGERFKERHHLTRHLSSHTTPISRLTGNGRYFGKHKISSENSHGEDNSKVSKS